MVLEPEFGKAFGLVTSLQLCCEHYKGENSFKEQF